MNHKRWILIASLIILTLVICGVGLWVAQVWESWTDFRDVEHKTLQDLSQRLGIEADWDAISRHVYCDMLHAGMSQYEIEVQLDKIGDYSWKRDEVLTLWVSVYFEDDIIGLHLGPMQLRFDETNKLEWPVRYTDMGDPNPVECP